MAKKEPLSKHDADMLRKLDSSFVSSLSNLRTQDLNNLKRLVNLLLEDEKEYFFIAPTGEEEDFSRRHYGLRFSLIMFKRLFSMIEHAESELNRRVDEKDD